jgi:hypothetical protein
MPPTFYDWTSLFNILSPNLLMEATANDDMVEVSIRYQEVILDSGLANLSKIQWLWPLWAISNVQHGCVEDGWAECRSSRAASRAAEKFNASMRGNDRFHQEVLWHWWVEDLPASPEKVEKIWKYFGQKAGQRHDS